MENAAKALLMAGGVLIAILLLTLFSYLFVQMSTSVRSIYEVMEDVEISEFNQQFLNYDSNQAGVELTVQDVATIINLAQTSYKEKKISITVKINETGGTTNRVVDLEDSDLAQTWLTEHAAKDKDTRYTCTVGISAETLYVNSVEITEN